MALCPRCRFGVGPLATIPAVGGGIRFFALSQPAGKLYSFTAYSSTGKLLEQNVVDKKKPRKKQP